MKGAVALCTALLAVCLCAASDVTPLRKVVELLKDMKTKGDKEMQEEQVQYASFKQFCEDTAVEKQRAIKEGKEAIEVLDATIQKNAADADRLASEIMGHMSTVESATSEKEAAAKVRASERQDFQATLKDYIESIDAIGRALRELKQKTAKEGALVQLKALQLPEQASRGLHALLSEGYGLKQEESLLDSLDDLTPDASYEFQSGGVIQMLEHLQDKFVDERAQLEKEELKKKNSFALMQQSLENQVTQAKKEEQDKTAFKAKKLQEKAGAESELTEAKAGLKVDETFAQDLAATCARKASDFQERQKVRAEELEAIQKASDIMSSEQVSGASLVQRTALAMLRAERSPVQAQVARFLQQAGERLNSRVLTSLSERAAADPMGKVRQMIEQLVVRLREQANAETTKKGWCDTELATNLATREEKTDAVDTLNAEIDELKASMAKLGEDVKTLSSELVQLNSDMSKATELRQKEKHENEVTVKDAKEAQTAVARAMVVLKDFYAKAGESSLLQTSTQVLGKAPAIFGDEPYQGMQDSTGGVLGLLEVIEADFARLQADTSAAEAAAATEHDSFMQDSKITKAEKSKEVEHKTARKQDKSSELINLEADLHGSQKELDAAMAYFDKLKSDCLDAGSSYAERKQRREQEIADLQEALTMMSTE
eukprot:CAMPEP_0197665222 /NCGR_PEP_ID=MMETSP1338-20131121/59100_1 /TAXON_ID=43686 ORGANISM="Pelagodinium beii, Strain RCC1491" /NCGR_SAMPLE_ID=MMETSP1338 /ASSEMBLY_ACC=CAM_ASM_000754 /LENGTH=660 /DNA_ID=CAMNT_0043243995 /DNA_START=17 /DNA_END=1999 /DNA_ORIENTATION=-